MIETLQSILSATWTFISAHYQWMIGILIPIILFWLSQRGKKIELEERVVEAYEDDVDDSIAHRSFIRNVIIGAGTLWLFAWLLGDEDE